MRAERSKPKEQVLPKSVNAIVVTNLSYSVREEALKAYVSKTFGAVNSVTLVVDDKKRSKGFAFIEFTDSASCQKALDAREFKLEGRIALIKQSNREVTQKRKPAQASDTLAQAVQGKSRQAEKADDEKARKRDKKKKFKANFKVMMVESRADEQKTSADKEETKVNDSNADFKSLLFGP